MIKAYIYNSEARLEKCILITREGSNGVTHVAKVKELEWVDYKIGYNVEPTFGVKEIDSKDTLDSHNALVGENKALKNEIEFLRKQIEILVSKHV